MNQQEIKNTIIDSSLAALAAVACSSSSCAIGVAALVPILSSVFKAVSNRPLGSFETKKIEFFFSNTIQLIKERLEKGDCIRTEESFFSDYAPEITNAQVILEGTIEKARNEYEYKKIKLLSNFYANLCFDNAISNEKAYLILKIYDRLSYRQLLILAYSNTIKEIKMTRWDQIFKGPMSNADRYFDFYIECLSLYEMRLFVQSGIGVKLGLSDCKISSMGSQIVNLFGLDQLKEEYMEIDYYFKSIERVWKECFQSLINK